MNDLLAQFPEDQRRALLARLGLARCDQLAESIDAEEIKVDRPRGAVPAPVGVSVPAYRYYWACIRSMGPLPQAQQQGSVPNPAWAWLEILRMRFEENPTFSHLRIAETVAYFGGWKRMWAEFGTVPEDRARNRFIMAYKDVIGEKPT